MLRHTHEIKDIFSTLPDELIVLIGNWLKDDDTKSISLTSSHFLHLCGTSLYARSLRFCDWQKAELKKLTDNLESFKGTHQITLLSPANRSFGRNIKYYGELMFYVVAPLIIAYLVKDRLIDKTDHTINLPEITALVLIILFSILNITSLHTLASLENMRFLLSPITQEHRNKLQEFIQNNKILMNPIMEKINDITTNSNLLNLLQQEVNSIENLSNSFEAYLKSNRTSAKQFLDQNDLNTLEEKNSELPKFARHTVGLWCKNNKKKESLFIDDPNPNDIKEDSQFARNGV